MLLSFKLGAKNKTEGKTAYAVWDKTCYKLANESEAIAPLVNGMPDYKGVKLTGLLLPSGCMHYELR